MSEVQAGHSQSAEIQKFPKAQHHIMWHYSCRVKVLCPLLFAENLLFIMHTLHLAVPGSEQAFMACSLGGGVASAHAPCPGGRNPGIYKRASHHL